MPKQKDLKRIVRSRMQKTGESYTAARAQVLRKKEAPKTPPPDYAALAGMADASIKKGSGRDWVEWVKVLDAWDASTKPHRDIAAYVHSLGTPDWWSQSVTVGYERIRGLREIGQRRGGGYETNKSKTFAVPVAKLFDAFVDAKKRAKWLATKVKVRTANPHKTLRLSMDDGTLVGVFFTDKGAKSAVAIQHQKLLDKAAAERLKSWWGERFEVLAEMLA